MKMLFYFLFALGGVFVAEVLADSCAVPSQAVPVYRAFHNAIGDHFYTINNTEYAAINTANGYFGEGAHFRVFSTQVSSTVQLFRLWNGGDADHFYTIDTTTASTASATGYVQENTDPMFVYSSQVCGSVPLLRYYNLDKTDHFYTISPTEVDNMPGYEFERVEGYALPLTDSSSSSGGTASGASPPAKTNAAIPLSFEYLYSLLSLALAVAYL
ncbi:hypothetical protein MVEN_00711000 [Mycena venus]|uniref:DUF5648 domain-containing protein n=1 Tax=Mycena venus TaxID=2733690 RepID=A0A8H6YKB4_9AGAR|nr:hypothetical protein MVEN_00711000 [Mycena venus]